MRYLESAALRRDLVKFWLPVLLGLLIAAFLARQFQLLMLGVGMVWTTGYHFLYAARSKESVGESAKQLIFAWTAVMVVLAVTVFWSGRQETGGSFLEYRGVHIEQNVAATFGVAPPGAVDIALPRPRDPSVEWRGEVTWRGAESESAHLRFAVIPAGTVISVCPAKPDTDACDSSWRLLSGSILTGGDSLAVRGGELLRIARERGEWFATIGAARYSLGADTDTLFARRDLLERGVPLALLRDRGSTILPVADHITIREIGPKESIETPTGSGSSWWSSAMAAMRRGDRTGRFVIQLSPAADPEPTRAAEWSLDRRTIVRVQSGQAGWRFQLDPATPLAKERPGVSLRFIRNPRPYRFSLVAEDACGNDVACNAVSLRSLPAPTSYLYLGEAGPDTLRYRFQARTEEASDSLRLLTASARYGLALNADRLTDVAVQHRDRQLRSGLSLLFSATRGALGSSWQALAAAVGIICLFIGLGQLILGLNIGAYRVSGAHATYQRSLMLIAAGVVTLAVARSILSLRVALYAPFSERVATTGIAIWPALAMLLVALAFLPERRSPSPMRFRSPTAWRALRSLWRRIRVEVLRDGVANRVPRNSLYLLGASFLAFFFVLQEQLFFALAVGLFVALAFVGTSWVSDVARRRPAQLAEIGSAAATICAVAAAVLLPAVPSAIPIVIVGAVAWWMLRDCWDDVVQWLVGFALMVVPAWALATFSDNNGAAANFHLVAVSVLLILRVAEGIRNNHHDGKLGWLQATVLLSAPLVALAFLAPIDLGLFLVVALPLTIAAYLRAGVGWAFKSPWLISGAVVILVGMIALFGRNIAGFGQARWNTANVPQLLEAFDEQRRFLGIERVVSPLAKGLDVLASRRIALYGPEAAQRLAVRAPGGYAQSTLVAAVEQHWGVQAYAAGGGVWGEGIGKAQIGGRGVAEAVSYAENTFSVYVLGEHGAVGGAVVLVAYCVILLGTAWYIATLASSRERWEEGQESFVGAALLAVPAAYVAASNVGLLPVTGQNMPFLGLNGWSDVLFCCLAVGLIIQGIRNGTRPGVASSGRSST